jgi:hypothetical protein
MCSFSHKTVALRRGTLSPHALQPCNNSCIPFRSGAPLTYSAPVETLRSDRLEEEIGGYIKDV